MQVLQLGWQQMSQYQKSLRYRTSLFLKKYYTIISDNISQTIDMPIETTNQSDNSHLPMMKQRLCMLRSCPLNDSWKSCHNHFLLFFPNFVSRP